MRLLAWSNCWCRVQTVKILSCWHQQLFTLHVFKLPVVYCLTVRKDLPKYNRIFEVLHSKAEKLGAAVPTPGCNVPSSTFAKLCLDRSAGLA
ncbi:hypothetical protein T07_14872 [Trichinella nelsoni]|uniref:Uncharacterized protein n=1 Tax=Trichinella nelsoni TaxID=6336 RepID=A0A0V0S0S1_9BILA|nr:hypothetical protein T07_14872 [Trichinella nelsoni]